MKKRTSMCEVCCFVFVGGFHMRRMLKRTAATLLSLALLGSGLTAMPEGTLRLNAPLTASAADDTVVKTGNILYLRGNPTRKTILNYAYDRDITEIFAMEGASLPTDCSYLFKGTDNYWPKLKTVDLSHANTSSVTDMEGMFNSHSGLTTVNLSGIDTSKVEDMSSMFASTSLSHIDLSSFNTSNVEDMRWMFYNCENLTYLDLTGFSSESLDYAQSMFKDCINLKRIFTTDRFRYYVQSNTQGMFGNCYSLVGGNGTTYDKSKDAESYNGLYARLSDQAGETSFFTRRCAKLDYWQENGMEWATLTLTGNVDGDIMRSLYRDTDSLRSVIRIVKTDGTAVLPEDCTGLFEGYENLVNVEFYDIDSSNVTTTEAMFRNCPELWQVDISGMDTSNVIYMYQMFCNCCELVTITVGDGWTIENCSTLSCKEMFLDCVKIRGEKGTTYDSTDSWASYGVFAHVDEAPSNPGYLWFHYLDMDFDTCTLTLHGNITKQRLEYTLSDITVKHIIAAPGTVFPADSSQFFTSCKDVVSMDLSAADTSNVTDMSEMFSGLTGLETLDITGWDTSNVTDMQQMFYQDSRLKTVYVGSGWTTEAVQAEGGRDYSYQMLGGCTSLVGTLGNMLGTHPTNKAYANLDSLDDEGVFSTKSFTYNFSNENLYLNGEIDRSLLIRYWGSPYGRPFINGIVANEGTVLPESCRYLFSGFENAKYIDLSHADASHVTDMTGMFCDNETGLTNLQRISFGAAFDISNVTTMEMMFYNCSALTSLDLSFFRTDQLQIVRGMFANCSSLKTVYINPETWKLLYGAAVYHNGMFAGCTSIVGANGTVYDSAHTNKLYARLDKDGEPGYFSARCYTFSNGKLTIFGQVNLYEVYSFPNKDLVTEIYAKEGTVLPEDCEGLFSD